MHTNELLSIATIRYLSTSSHQKMHTSADPPQGCFGVGTGGPPPYLNSASRHPAKVDIGRKKPRP